VNLKLRKTCEKESTGDQSRWGDDAEDLKSSRYCAIACCTQARILFEIQFN